VCVAVEKAFLFASLVLLAAFIAGREYRRLKTITYCSCSTIIFFHCCSVLRGRESCERLGVLAATNMKNTLSWDVTLCSLIPTFR
jgi:predicted nucleic acid-binding Zn finger protein